jgi:hypothetical protein
MVVEHFSYADPHEILNQISLHIFAVTSSITFDENQPDSS